MSDYQTPPASPPKSRLSLWQIWGAMALFGPLHLAILFLIFASLSAEAGNPLSAVLLAAIHGGLAAGLYFGLGQRSYAAGILLGYALLSLVSGGACTLLSNEQADYRAVAALVLYPGAIVLLGLGIGIYKFVKR